MALDINRSFPCDRRNYATGRGGEAIRYLVIHYVGALGRARANAQYYGSTRVGASAHYFVGHASEGAAIYASVPEADTAWHCGGGLQGPNGHTLHGICKNANSIGVELCCHQDGTGRWFFDPETVDRGVELVSYLMARHGIPAERVVRHYDVTGKICPAPYVLDEGAWQAFQTRLEDMDMTLEQFQALRDEADPVYWELEDVPGYWREETRKLLEAGAISGDGLHAVAKRRSVLEAAIVAMRYADRAKRG